MMSSNFVLCPKVGYFRATNPNLISGDLSFRLEILELQSQFQLNVATLTKLCDTSCGH